VRSSVVREVIAIGRSDEPAPLDDVGAAVEMESDREKVLGGDPILDTRHELVQIADPLWRKDDDEGPVQSVFDPADPLSPQLAEELQRMRHARQLKGSGRSGERR
jgi:hypothetical protein